MLPMTTDPSRMPQVLYSDPKPDGTVDFWLMDGLWKRARELPVVRRSIGSLPGLDQVLWFGGPGKVEPTCRLVAEHARRIVSADLSFPVILSAEGDVWDGMHRIAKAYLQGVEEVDVVQFIENPPPDGTLRPGDAAAVVFRR